MKYNSLSRRMFLSGMRNVMLTIPILPSLLSREALAQVMANKPVRFITGNSLWAPEAEYFVGNLAADQWPTNEFGYKSLAGLSNISRIFGSNFDSLLPKTNIIRGIDMLNIGASNVQHDAFLYGSCGCPGMAEIDARNGSDRPPFIGGINSIDVILSKSNKMYPANFPTARKHINIVPFKDFTNPHIEHQVLTSAIENSQYKSEVITSTQLYNIFMSDLTNGTVTPSPSPVSNTANSDIMSAVYEDYSNTSKSPKLSTEDKKRLTDFMDLVSEVVNKYKVIQSSDPIVTPKTCQKVTFDASRENAMRDLRLQNQADILVAAMACDLTRVVHWNMNLMDARGHGNDYQFSDVPDFHIAHHKLSDDRSKFASTEGQRMTDAYISYYTRTANTFAYLMKKMDSIQETGGTMLDNSLLYWFPNFGFPNRDIGNNHASVDMGIMMAGSAGGVLKTGYFLDYRHRTEKYNATPGGGWPYVGDLSVKKRELKI